MIEEVNVDLDGVLVDFERTALAIAGFMPTDKEKRKAFWNKVGAHVKSGGSFFKDMSPLEDAFELWDYVKKHNTVICSATGSVRGAAAEKTEWVRKHLGDSYAATARLVPDAKDKAQYAKPTVILIDDRAKAIDPWVAAGGIGILHTSAASTIARLKEYGL